MTEPRFIFSSLVPYYRTIELQVKFVYCLFHEAVASSEPGRDHHRRRSVRPLGPRARAHLRAARGGRLHEDLLRLPEGPGPPPAQIDAVPSFPDPARSRAHPQRAPGRGVAQQDAVRGAEIEVRSLDRGDPQGLSIPVTVPIQAKVNSSDDTWICNWQTWKKHEPLLLGTLSNGSPISPAILRAHSASLRVFARARNGHASLFEIGIGTADWITGSNIAETSQMVCTEDFSQYRDRFFAAHQT